MFAQRTSLFKSSGTAAARAAAKAAADQGVDVIDLTCGEIFSDVAPAIRQGALAAIDRGVNRYTDTVGMIELRDALARKVSLETGQLWKSDEIAVTHGAKQALFNTAMVLLNAGDEVIIPSPYWTTFPAQVLAAGGQPVFVDTRLHGFVPEPDVIRTAITERTKVILINTPNNPTGAVYPEETLTQIIAIAKQHDLWIVFDECYGTFVHGGSVHHSITGLDPEIRARTVVINSFSKSLALTGWRLGYMAAPAPMVSAVKALQSHSTSNPNVIAQHAVLHYLRSGDGSFQDGLKTILSVNRDIGLRILADLKTIPLPKAEGGFYFYLDLSAYFRTAPGRGRFKDSLDLVTALISKAGVAGVSGTAFGDPTGLRLSYGVPADQLERGLTKLVGALNGWR